MRPRKPRQIALRVLCHWRKSRKFVDELLDAELAKTRLSAPDRALCRQLVCGVVQWRATLDWLISRKTKGKRQKPMPQLILQLGLYQMFWLERVPEHAIVNEAVELAKSNSLGKRAGFINAVLRSYARERDATRKLLDGLKTAHPPLGYSHPEWLWSRWSQRWGDETAKQLMEWNNTPPVTCARVNTLKTDPGKLLAQWREEDVEYDFIYREWLEENLAFELKSYPQLTTLQSFKRGWFYIQDPSTLLAVRELDPRPGETVLDLCAAPGGKTTYIAQLMRNSGRIVATDVSESRLGLVRENCARLGVTCVEVKLASELQTSAAAEFDRVLVDAPCTNTGVMRRRPDLRWRIKPEEIIRLQGVQLELLERAAPLVKSGGVLVYSTCSLEPEEN
ncbi:MAG: 16S rRNA (cytosine(967)-C(5))-methyltransferase RsmB, partial [Verrucomicrobiae bacterium]|nr:16S rRNA (cytosine(967)-C(5))-methyltransferase RsmB [Verrucomicrobiae bacterium]